MSITWLQARIKLISRRPPDFVIGGTDFPYLRRWFVIPRNPLFNVYLHQFLRSDDDRALHDHPWLFNVSWILEGRYTEHTIADGGIQRSTLRNRSDLKVRWGPAPHRVELMAIQLPGRPTFSCLACWTLFITGPRVREWGFHCPEQGWVHWRQFTAKDDPGAVGAGCEGVQP